MSLNSIELSLESIVNEYRGVVAKEESANYVAVPEKSKVFHYTLDHIGECVRGVKITSGTFKPFKSMAYITLTGRRPEIVDTVMFVELARLASNIEVSLKMNGNVVIDFTYHGFAVPASNGGM